MDIALIGIGKIALDQHVPALKNSSDWDLKATVSRKGVVDGVDAYTDFQTFLDERPEARVVSLALPPVPRFDYASAAIASGRHVMLEKPPGATLAECYKLARMAEEAGVTLFASWHSREAAMVSAAKAWLADKHLIGMDVTWKEDVRRWHPGQDWIWQAGGLGVFDPGINALSIMTKILPHKMHLKRSILEVPENKQAPIAAELVFAYPGKVEVSAVFDWRHEGLQTWQIKAETDQGTLRLYDGGGRMSIDDVEQPSPADALAGEYPNLYAQMAKLVTDGKSDTDFEPLRHVADAFMLGQRKTVAPFYD